MKTTRRSDMTKSLRAPAEPEMVDGYDDEDDDADDEIRWNASAEASLVYKGLCETLDRWQGDLRPLEETLSQVLRTVRERMKEPAS